MTQAVAKATPETLREKLVMLESAILACPQMGWETLHHFAPGVYLREVRMKAGHVFSGAIHKKAHLNILVQGELEVLTDDGMKRIEAPAVIPSDAGIKRAARVLKDVVWMTICHNPDDLTDVPQLEERYTAKTFDELDTYLAQEAPQKQITEDT
jgi:hypothetical protein